jgi:flavin-dependent dehydrogenase
MTGYDADLLIVGGGPAGLACALHARRHGLSVIVTEPRTSPIDKACGEGLMPGGLSELLKLDVDPAGIPLRGIAYLNGHRRAQADFEGGAGRGVRRTTLHGALAERSKAAGAQSITTRISEVRQDSAGVSAVGVSAAGIRTRWLIGADGLHSPVRRALGIAAVAGTPRRYGVRRHYPIAPWSEHVEVYWSPWGEAYVTPVQPDLVGVAILSRHKQPDLAWFGQLSARLRGVEPGPPRGCGSLRQVVARRVEGRVLLVGDAAGYEDALTGEGVSLAVRQAAAAIEAIAENAPQSYEAAWHQVTRRYRLLTRALVLATSPRLTRRAIVPAAALAPALFRHAVNTLAH